VDEQEESWYLSGRCGPRVSRIRCGGGRGLKWARNGVLRPVFMSGTRPFQRRIAMNCHPNKVHQPTIKGPFGRVSAVDKTAAAVAVVK
jgi:hypothetical protein